LKIRASDCLLKTHDYANSIEHVYNLIIVQCHEDKKSALRGAFIIYGK